MRSTHRITHAVSSWLSDTTLAVIASGSDAVVGDGAGELPTAVTLSAMPDPPGAAVQPLGAAITRSKSERLPYCAVHHSGPPKWDVQTNVAHWSDILLVEQHSEVVCACPNAIRTWSFKQDACKFVQV